MLSTADSHFLNRLTEATLFSENDTLALYEDILVMGWDGFRRSDNSPWLKPGASTDFHRWYVVPYRCRSVFIHMNGRSSQFMYRMALWEHRSAFTVGTDVPTNPQTLFFSSGAIELEPMYHGCLAFC